MAMEEEEEEVWSDPAMGPTQDGNFVLDLAAVTRAGLLPLLNWIFPADPNAFYYTCSMDELLALVYLATGYNLVHAYYFVAWQACYLQTCARVFNRKPNRNIQLTLCQMPDRHAWRLLAQRQWADDVDDDIGLIQMPGAVWSKYRETRIPVCRESLLSFILYCLDLPRNDILEVWFVFRNEFGFRSPNVMELVDCHIFLKDLFRSKAGPYVRGLIRSAGQDCVPGLREMILDEEDNPNPRF